ncbi:preprotein translocase subunit SecE [Candidatus Saccharibacteria bacterium RIFCSPHIGHO2_02_FULL_47_12]|nr:MAG: preprotein translocase subunit SecE [Candidatus Saccharibacteria bacterium RIFCSPHIGHO2_02_FULL_47_12]
MAEKKTKRRIKQAQPIGGQSRQKTGQAASAREQARTKSAPKPAKKRRTLPAGRQVRAAGKAAVKPLRVFRFLGVFRFLVPKYFRNSWLELKQVTWPSRKETWQLTFAVFTFAVIFGLLVGVTDYGLDKIFKRILLNL